MVDTMPEETLEAKLDRGDLRLTIKEGLEEARSYPACSPRPAWTTTTLRRR
jgi:hypothetical protein